jgi:hypothetical protein
MTPLTSVEKIDAANIGLMFFSCVMAFVLPFELFLFSYAVLGPLHYLTEIGWLHKKGYYTTGKYDYLFLGVLSALITIGFLGLSDAFEDVATGLVYLSFLMALVMVLVKDTTLKIVSAILLLFSTMIFNKSGSFEVFFAVFLPTIIHVFCFTGLFILYGALKNKSRLGMLSLLVFAGCTASFFLIPVGYSSLIPMQTIQKSIVGFVELNRQLINFFGFDQLQEFTSQSIGVNSKVIFFTQSGFVVMRFIAFAYTYHYLNWFSKTSVIQWHKVPRKTLAIVIAVWVISVCLYMYDYMVGLKWLFLLSFLHVLLEFPLNFRSIIGIGEEVKNLIIGKPSPKATTK